MKILCLIDTLGPGGAQRQLVGLASFLREKGFDVTVAAYYENCFYKDLLLKAGVHYEYIKKMHETHYRQWHLMRYIRNNNPNIVISYLESPSIRACVAHIFNHSFKLIVSERNTTQHTGIKEKLRFNLFRLANFVVPNAYAQADYISENFAFLKGKVITIPNFVDLEHFTPSIIRQRHNIPEIVVVATIWASKNTLGFIDAVAKMKESGKQFHVSWYGKDSKHVDYYTQCKKKIDRQGLNDYIDLKDKTPAIKEKYQEADFFCLPSFYEGTPNVICEAMACGLPIICSNVCDNSRYVIEGENGCLFNPHDVDSICVAFEKMLSLTEQEYSILSCKSRAIAEQKFSKEQFVQSYIKLINL